MARIRLLTALLLVLAMASPAWAIGTISDGPVSFTYTTPNFLSGSSDTVNVDIVGTGAGDQIYESWWFFRVNGDVSETAFGSPDGEVYASNYASLVWSDVEGRGLFGAQLELGLLDGGSASGNLFQALTITNALAIPLTIDIFHYTDFDVGGSSGSDSAVLDAAGADIQMTISDGVSGDTVPFIAYGVDAFRVTDYPTLLGALTNGFVTDLDGSGLPLVGGDFTGAFQWSLTLAGNESRRMMTQFGVNNSLLAPSMMPVPEPASALMVSLGLLGLAWQARRAGLRRRVAPGAPRKAG